MSNINYKFREDELLAELTAYIDKTYDQHYSTSRLQCSEVVVDRGHGIGFFLGNVDKYNGRYGKKGTSEDHRKDLFKILHYALLGLCEHDRINSKKSNKSVYKSVETKYNSPYEYVGDTSDHPTIGVNYDQPTKTAYSINDATPQEWTQAYYSLKETK
jgi:hypothetical protein